MYLLGLILYAFYITHCAFSDLLNKCSIFSHSKHFIYIMFVCIYLILKSIFFSGYGPPLGLPDRLLGRRGVAGLGPRRAATLRDGGAEVLLPGKGYAPRGCRSRDPWLRLALRPARPGRWGAGSVSLFLHPSGRSPLCFCSLAGAGSSAALLGWCEQVPHPKTLNRCQGALPRF